ncbi:methyltransferase [Albimonas sp. CAU 1670]|uniref:tRNA1(Val) (adenine(37)-N6)-methyltransferase n=1 Tax=Albimonas sp. CAU 1670 TaxID=3032599 RepID=UPI0023DA4719|nr:methyltransferase [Albimonas sp. CAU 1670]MDF2235169.1 methyltransferase [Albimonas sp. CAU 1670]
MLRQPRRGYRAATDPVLLAAACPARAGDVTLDLGCGAGAAALCLASRVPGLELHGLEIQPAYAALARRNAAEAGTTLTVHEGDMARPPAELRAMSFDLVLTNPPWYPPGAPAPEDVGRSRAHVEAAPIADWIAAALRRLRPGGRLVAIHRAEALARIVVALDGRAGDLRILPLSARAGRPARRVIVAARKGAKGPPLLLAPLVLHDGPRHEADREDFSDAARAVLRDAAPLRLDPTWP